MGLIDASWSIDRSGVGCKYNAKCLMHGIFILFIIFVGVGVGRMFALFIGVMSSILGDLSTKAVGNVLVWISVMGSHSVWIILWWDK